MPVSDHGPRVRTIGCGHHGMQPSRCSGLTARGKNTSR